MTTSSTRSTDRPALSSGQLSMLGAMLAEQEQFRSEQIAELARESVHRRHHETGAEAQVREALLLGARVALTATRTARARLAYGTYGRCQGCDVRLAAEQLEVLPHATLCPGCRREGVL